MLRAQDYSTTSLEFSDVDSFVSDSLGRASEEEEELDEAGGWNRPVPPPHGATEQQFQMDGDPVSFVEFASADDHEVASEQEQSPRKRSVTSCPSSSVYSHKIFFKHAGHTRCLLNNTN